MVGHPPRQWAGLVRESRMTDTGSGEARDGAWRQVRDAAVRAVHRGWSVVPGICRPDDLGFSRVCPLGDTWDSAPITDPERAEEVWTACRHVGVLLVCGRGIDALEVPFRVTEVVPALGQRGVRVPIATALAPSRWLLFVATGSGTLWPELAAVSVRWRGIGQWVALPPTTLGGYPPVRWTVAPTEDHALYLPGAQEVQRMLAEALSSGHPDAPG